MSPQEPHNTDKFHNSSAQANKPAVSPHQSTKRVIPTHCMCISSSSSPHETPPPVLMVLAGVWDRRNCECVEWQFPTVLSSLQHMLVCQ